MLYTTSHSITVQREDFLVRTARVTKTIEVADDGAALAALQASVEKEGDATSVTVEWLQPEWS